MVYMYFYSLLNYAYLTCCNCVAVNTDEASKTILAAHSGLLTAENVEIVLSEPRLFLPLLFCLTLVVSSIVTAYACYKRVVAKYSACHIRTLI